MSAASHAEVGGSFLSSSAALQCETFCNKEKRERKERKEKNQKKRDKVKGIKEMSGIYYILQGVIIFPVEIGKIINRFSKKES